MTPAVAGALNSGREEAVVCPGPGEMPAVVIWKQFDPLAVRMPRLPPAYDSARRLRGHGAVWY